MKVVANDHENYQRMKLQKMKRGESACANRTRASGSGFTLIEAVVSLPIVAVALVSLYACFTQGFNVIGQERKDLRATQIMLKQLERIRLSPFAQLTSTNYNPQTFTDYSDPPAQSSCRPDTVHTS